MTPEREKRITDVLNHRQNDITVVLENVFDPHNISAVMRTCDAIGMSEIFVLNTKIPTHKKFGKSSSSSALKWMQIHQYTDMSLCIAAVKKKYNRLLATHLNADAVSLYQIDFTVPTALVFGNEKEGVSDELLVCCDGNFLIPQVGMIKSLNISVACAVSLYEAFRQKNNAGHYKDSKLSNTEKLALLEYWDTGLPRDT
jgi:rRNA methylases